jgi:uroporphyrinogen-III synthase
MSDSDKPSSSSLWQPVSPGTGAAKITDVTPEPIKSSSSTVSATSSPGVSTGGGNVPPRTPPSDRVSSLPPPNPPTAPPPRKRGLGGVAGAIVFVAATLGVLYALAPHWLPALMQRAGVTTTGAPTPAPTIAGMSDAERQKLETQFADLNARLNALKTPGADPALNDQIKKVQAQLEQLMKEQTELADMVNHPTGGKPGTSDRALDDKLDALQKQLEALSAAAAAGKSARGEIDSMSAELAKAIERNTKLEQRLAELEKAVASQQNVDQRSVDAARASAMMSLAARLRGNVDAGRPFADDLAALKPLVKDDADLAAALAALEPLSSGSDGIAALRQSFPPVARAAVAAGKNDAADGWFDKAVARLSSIVSVRRVGDVQGDSVEARVARAETALNNGRLDSAVAELKPLGGNAGKAVAAWLSKAEKQLAASVAADKVQALASQRLAALQQAR